MRLKLKAPFLWVFFSLVFGNNILLAASSPLVPLNDWSYSALEKLVVCGFADADPLSSRPLTRLQMAQIVAEAVDSVQSGYVDFSALEDTKGLELLMDGLIEEYREELIVLKVNVAEISEEKTLPKRLRIHFPERISLDKRLAAFETGRTLLVENANGWRLQKGFNLRADTSLSLQWDDWLTVAMTPSLRVAKTDTNLLLEELYAETGWKNISFSLGRQSFWWGPGYHGSLVLSNNAFPLTAFRIRSNSSYEFPGFLEKLGKWRTDFFLAQLGGEQNIKRPKFSGLRQEWSPASWLSFGGSHTIIFGGEGAREFDGFDLFSAYFKNESGNIEETENHVAGWDWQLKIPRFNPWIPFSHGIKLYGEYAFEDAGFDLNLLTLKASASHLHGLYIADLFRIRDLDFRVEFAQIDPGAYEHFLYRTGYRHKGELLGYHTGPDSRNFYCQLTKRFEDFAGDTMEAGILWNFQQSGMSEQPLIQTLSDLSFFLSRPGPWGFLLKTTLSILHWKNFEHRSSAVDADLVLNVTAARKW